VINISVICMATHIDYMCGTAAAEPSHSVLFPQKPHFGTWDHGSPNRKVWLHPLIIIVGVNYKSTTSSSYATLALNVITYGTNCWLVNIYKIILKLGLIYLWHHRDNYQLQNIYHHSPLARLHQVGSLHRHLGL
jgi:hypothetical protein